MAPSRGGHQFILSAFDREQWCPVLQVRFAVDDLQALRAILGEAAADDPDLGVNRWYDLSREELDAVSARFAAALDLGGLQAPRIDVFLEREDQRPDPPYLIHTGYELPLLLDGRKKLARMSHEYPPDSFWGEEAFEKWVAAGVLHREEVREPFDEPVRDWLGSRTVYYTPKGEEWRIPAMKLLFAAFGRSPAWNEHFERLEGMLFGYEDWQNDWWIERIMARGGFGGMAFCCAVSAAGLAWLEAAGFRALPPPEGPTLTLVSASPDQDDQAREMLLADPSAAAIVRFGIAGRYVMDYIPIRDAGPYRFPSDKVPEINRHLKTNVQLIARRG